MQSIVIFFYPTYDRSVRLTVQFEIKTLTDDFSVGARHIKFQDVDLFKMFAVYNAFFISANRMELTGKILLQTKNVNHYLYKLHILKTKRIILELRSQSTQIYTHLL